MDQSVSHEHMKDITHRHALSVRTNPIFGTWIHVCWDMKDTGSVLFSC